MSDRTETWYEVRSRCYAVTHVTLNPMRCVSIEIGRIGDVETAPIKLVDIDLALRVKDTLATACRDHEDPFRVHEYSRIESERVVE